MTVQRSNAITLEEVIGIQFECKSCRAKTSIPISSKARGPIRCGICGDPWVVEGRTDLHQAFFTAVAELMAAVKQIADGSLSVNCVFSLELKSEIKASSFPDPAA